MMKRDTNDDGAMMLGAAMDHSQRVTNEDSDPIRINIMDNPEKVIKRKGRPKGVTGRFWK
jgi:hypothetical protein